jgi:hypothetical protein
LVSIPTWVSAQNGVHRKMKLTRVKWILEAYGLERILEDNQMMLSEALDILCDLGYIDLDMYLREEPDDYLNDED